MFSFMSRKKRLEVFSYIKIFVSFVAVVLTTNTLLSSSMYVNYERHSFDLVQSYTVEELSQVSYSTNFMFQTAKQTLLQLYANPAVLKLMNYDDLSELEAASLLQQVGVVSINVPFINSIYIYNRQAGKIYYDSKAFPLSSFPDQDILERLDKSGEIRSMRPIARRIPSPSVYTATNRDGFMDDVYTFVFIDSVAKKIDNAIILNVSQEWMKSTLESMNPDSSNETLIVDSSGMITLGNDTYHYLENIHQQVDLKEVLDRKNESGYVVKKMDGEKYLITYVSSSLLDWKYMRFTPYRIVFGKLKQMLLVTLFIFVLVTVLSVLAVLFFSKTVYGLFSRKIGDIERKFAAEKNTGYEKKQQFLRMITTQKISESKVKEKFLQFNIGFNLEEGFMTMVLKADHYREYCSKYTLEERELFSYEMVTILNGMKDELFLQEAVDLGSGQIGVVFNISRNHYQDAAVRFENLVKEIQEKAQSALDISFSVAIGDMLDEISEVPDSMAKCMEAVEYRLFSGNKSVIYTSGIREIKEKEYVFQEESLENLMRYLLSGEKEQVFACCDSMMESTRGYSITSLQTMLLQLAIYMKESLKKYNVFAEEVNYDVLIDIANPITKQESLEEICGKLHEVFSDILEVLARSQETVKRHEKYSKLLENVDEFLKKEYANPNLSPEMIAGHFGISAKYLRTLYKKASGESLGESINRHRLTCAKSFLENTETSVNDVAVMSGFSNINYFYTLFKKYNGITPNEFRSLILSENKEKEVP